jgi:Flp pilus assembly protein TadD
MQGWMPSCRQSLRLVNNLGRVLQDLGDLAGARAAFERAQALLERRLGLEHPRARSVRENLGELGQL